MRKIKFKRVPARYVCAKCGETHPDYSFRKNDDVCRACRKKDEENAPDIVGMNKYGCTVRQTPEDISKAWAKAYGAAHA